MKRTNGILLIAAFAFAFLGCACDAFNDVKEAFGIETDHHRGKPPKEPYRYIPSMAVEKYGAAIDPYDGSLDLIDPVARDRATFGLKAKPSHAAALSDGTSIAMLDRKQNKVWIVDSATLSLTAMFEIGENLNRIIVPPGGPYLLAIYDPNYGAADFGDSGVINYYELNVLNLNDGTVRTVSIDFSPENILFAPDNASCLLGKEFRIVHLNLASGATTAYPLSLSPEDTRTPRDMSFSPDGEYAVILVEEARDIYTLDLVNSSINILELSEQATNIVFAPDTRIALFTLPDDFSLAVVDLDDAIPLEVDLGGSFSNMMLTPDGEKAILYEDFAEQVAVLSLAELSDPEPVFYQLNGLINSDYTKDAGNTGPVQASPDSRFIAVTVDGMGAYSSPGIDLIDLEAEGQSKYVVVPLGLESAPSDFLFSPKKPSLGILLPGAEKLVVMDLDTLQATSRPLGKFARRLSYIPAAEEFMVDYDHDRGKLTFVGDVGSEDFWIAIRLFDK